MSEDRVGVMLGKDYHPREESWGFLRAKLHTQFVLNRLGIGFILGRLPIGFIRRALGRTLPTQPAAIAKKALIELVDRQRRASLHLARTTLIWLANHKEPLSIAALLDSLAVKNQNPLESRDRAFNPREDALLDSCEGLAVVDHDNNLVRLAQDGFKDAAKDCWPAVYHNRLIVLSMTCLKYLLLKDFEGGYLKSEEKLGELLCGYAFLHYAAHYWSRHVRETADEDVQANDSEESDIPNEDSPTTGDFGVVQGDTSIPTVQSLTESLLERSGNVSLALQVLLYDEYEALRTPDRWERLLRKVDSALQLHVAARFGLLSVVHKLAANDEAVSKLDSENSTALHEAAKEGFEDVVARLLEANASATAKDCHGKTPMHYAQARGHTGVFDLLLERACEGYVEAWDNEEQLPWGDEDMDGLFAFYGSDHSSAAKESGQHSKERALIVASKWGKTAVAFALIVSGVSATRESADGLFPVHLAIQSQSDKMLRLLLAFDADPSKKTTDADQEPALLRSYWY
ncbi:hypothetical protein MMC30_006289 [Trapelia coarctata]|nr:hypothetical protein [Trapelia coarctata]